MIAFPKHPRHFLRNSIPFVLVCYSISSACSVWTLPHLILEDVLHISYVCYHINLFNLHISLFFIYFFSLDFHALLKSSSLVLQLFTRGESVGTQYHQLSKSWT